MVRVCHPREVRLRDAAAVIATIGGSDASREEHTHGEVEISILLAGRGEIRIRGGGFPSRAGDVYLCWPWEPHQWVELSPDAELAQIAFLPEWLGDERIGGRSWMELFSVAPGQRPRPANDRAREEVLAVAEGLRAEILSRLPAWEDALRLRVLLILLALGRTWDSWSEPRRRFPGYRGDIARITPALALARADPTRHVSLSEAAALCRLSRVQFCRVFRQTMGMTFGEFCLRTRLDLARRLLMSSEAPVDTIAQEAGFADASHLHRSFVKRFGCTPGQYRTGERG